MDTALCEGNLREPAECKLPIEETDEPTDTEEAGKQDRATEASAQKGRVRTQPPPKDKLRSPTSPPPSAECKGGRGIEREGKEERPGAERTGGGQTNEQDDRRLDTARLTAEPLNP